LTYILFLLTKHRNLFLRFLDILLGFTCRYTLLAYLSCLPLRLGKTTFTHLIDTDDLAKNLPVLSIFRKTFNTCTSSKNTVLELLPAHWKRIPLSCLLPYLRTYLTYPVTDTATLLLAWFLLVRSLLLFFLRFFRRWCLRAITFPRRRLIPVVIRATTIYIALTATGRNKTLPPGSFFNRFRLFITTIFNRLCLRPFTLFYRSSLGTITNPCLIIDFFRLCSSRRRTHPRLIRTRLTAIINHLSIPPLPSTVPAIPVQFPTHPFTAIPPLHRQLITNLSTGRITTRIRKTLTEHILPALTDPHHTVLHLFQNIHRTVVLSRIVPSRL